MWRSSFDCIYLYFNCIFTFNQYSFIVLSQGGAKDQRSQTAHVCSYKVINHIILSVLTVLLEFYSYIIADFVI